MRSSIKFDFLAFFSLPLYIIIYMHTFSAMKKKLFEKTRQELFEKPLDVFVKTP